MKSHNLLIMLLFALLAGCSQSGGGDSEDRDLIQPDDTVLVEVDGEPVTKGMLEFLMEVRGVGADEHDKMRQLLDELIRIRAMANAAASEGLADDRKTRAERAVKDMEILYVRYTEQYQQDNQLDDARLREVYNEQLERAGDTQYRLEVVAFGEQQAAAEAAARVSGGRGGFDALEGTADVRTPDWVDPSQLPPDAAADLKNTAVGEVLPQPVPLREAWGVARVVETRALEHPPFEEVKEGIARTLNRERVQKLIEQTYENADIKPILGVEDVE